MKKQIKNPPNSPHSHISSENIMVISWCIALSTLFIPILAQEENEICGENQFFSTCATACALTCENWAHPPTSCEKSCMARCTCVKGSVEFRGRCIPQEKCPKPPACYFNETFQNGGYDCATCRNYKTAECPYTAKAGCYCKPGYVRNAESGDCVLVKDCPLDSMCQENESYQEGGYDCANCVNLQLVSCQFKNEAGCYCKAGYVWSAYEEKCVLIANCPRVFNGHG